MLRLKSLGETLIEVDDARLTPVAETIFATALYLVVEGGHPVGRDELARLVWPDVPDRRAQHNLRQVVYKLRAMGASIKADRTTLRLAPRHSSADYAPLLAAGSPAAQEEIASRVEGLFLPGYQPALSDEFSAWVERQRDIVHSALQRALVAGMGKKKSRGDWHGAEKLAKFCLTIDPLNEEATLTVAEAAALGGSKARALSILNHYLQDIGTDAREIRLPAVMLRRRISEAHQDDVLPLREAPFVGRDEETAELNRALAGAQSGRGGAYLIWGEPGIGKSRLITEFTRAAALQRVQVVKVGCQSHDTRRPLSAFVDLVPKLLTLPGALGCSPESMQYLRRLTAHDPVDARAREELEQPDSRYDSSRRALLDLIDAVSSETCCIIVIDNVHWLDPQSGRFVEEVLDWLPSHHVLLVLTSREQSLHNEGVSAINLRPLVRNASRQVACALVDSGPEPKDDFIGWCVTSAGGNPYHLVELLRHGTKEHHGYQPPASLARLLQDRVTALSSDARRLLEVCCVLGKHSTLARIEVCLETRRARLLGSLSDLDARGLVQLDEDHVLSRHDLLTAVVLQQLSPVTKAMLHRFIALQLEKEADASQSISLLWECAEHWYGAAEASRAIQLLRRCGDHLIDVGMPLEAAQVLERALALSSTVEEQYAIGGQRVRALRRAERETESLEALEELLKLRESIHPEPSKLDEIGQMYAEARWEAGGAVADLMSDKLDALVAGSGSLLDRARAAAWLLTAADNLCDIELGHRIYQLALPSLNVAGLAPDVRLSLQLVYHCSFGDGSAAVVAANELLDYAREHNRMPLASRHMRYAGQALRCHGTASQAIAAYAEAFSTAEKMQAPLSMASSAASLASVYLHIGDLDSAEREIAVASACHPFGSSTVRDTNLLGNCCELAIRRDDIRSAESYWTLTLPAITRSRATRSEMRQLAMKMAISLARGELPTDFQLEEFQCAFVIARRSTMQDFAANTLILALTRLGRHADARHFANHFVSNDRRDLCALSDELSRTIQSLGAHADC
jgi:DNA-binding SARP family transcriptional activator/tetratricopeptide (TPR) repeat protein